MNIKARKDGLGVMGEIKLWLCMDIAASEIVMPFAVSADTLKRYKAEGLI